MLSRVHAFVLRELWNVLSSFVAIAQSILLYWLALVFFDEGEPWGLGGWLAIVLGLWGANLAMIPVVARARRFGGGWRRAGRAYIAGAGVTILLGGTVVAAWGGLYPLGFLLLGADGAWELFRVGSGLAVGLVALLLAWGFSGGQAQLGETHHVISIPGLARRHRGLRIVQISDLHIGNGIEGPPLEAMVARVNALAPDLIAITGDLFDFDPRQTPGGARALGKLDARLGVYAVLGNHDHHAGFDQVEDALREEAPVVRLLRDEFVCVTNDAPLYLAGVDDVPADWAARSLELESLERLAHTLPRDGPALLLVHRPEAFDQAERLGFPLVLAGHTHGGQISLPVFGLHLNIARLISRFDRGLYRRGDTTLYVNRGFGFAGPAIRIDCPREIAILELEPG